MRSAFLGEIALVMIMVETTFAASWNPLEKANKRTSEVTTMATHITQIPLPF
jgi:hypothetical protein